MNPTDFKAEFLASMRQAGFEPDCTIVADGNLHRFRDWLDKPGRKNGWYVLFPDLPPAGAFGCWRRGIKETWSGNSPVITHALTQRMAVIRGLTAAEYEKGRRETAKTWAESVKANGRHGYLQAKKVGAHGIRYHRGALLIPVMDAAGQIHGLERIYRDGKKRLTFATDKTGHFYLIGDPSNNIICIAEGYASAATIHEITGYAVVVAFGSDNLRSVAEILRGAYPECWLILCADDDKWTEGNPGLTKALLASDAVGVEVVVPHFSDFTSRGTDFNDLYLEEGREAVFNCFCGIGGANV